MIRDAWFDGVRRVRRAPAVLLGVYALTFATALPMALVLRQTLETHLGRSLEANGAADGVNYEWWEEFASQATGLGSSFTPSIIGFAAALDNISSVLDAQARIPPVLAAVVIYLLLWTFLSGGVIDRLARQRPTRAHGFFMACGVYFFRFVRIAAVAGIAYGLLYRYVHHWLFDEWLRRGTRDLDVERTVFIWRLGLYLLFGALLVAVNMVVDYARIRAVVEDRRSMLGAVVAALRFLRRHPREAAGLYTVNALAFAALIGIWRLVAPGAAGGGASIWLAFVVGQVYVAVRLLVKLQFIASQTALFQGSLAHARYTAAPAAAWPESPAVETIQRAG